MKLKPLAGGGAVAVQIGRTQNRARTSGFADIGEANAFCKTLSDAGQAWFIRR